MPNKDKLIKQGIRYTDKLFDEIVKRLEKGVRASDTLEAFLEKTAGYTTGNPLVESGYYDKMMKLILQETNNHKFSRPAQKELVRLTIENRVGDLIVDVGEDIKESVREVVKDGYNQNLSQDEIATNISEKVSSIKGKRAKAIARTEIARTATISDYIINKERGATHFYVECRNTACPVCKKAWHKGWTPENDATYKPRDKSAGGKGWIGNNVYSMSNTSKLPPIHPNCRCVPYFVSEDEMPKETTIVKDTTTTTTEPVEEVIDNSQKEKTSKHSKLANQYDYIEFTESNDSYHVYQNTIDECSIKFEKTVPLEDIEKYLDIYDSMEWVLKRSTKEIIFVDKPTDSPNTMGLNHEGRLLEIFLGNIRNHELGKLQGPEFVIAHELFHSVDIKSKTSFGGKEFSLKRIWQKAITNDDKNFKEQGVSAYYGNKNPIEHSPTAGSNVTFELFFGTERTLAMEDIADSIGVQFLKEGQKTPTDLGLLTKEEWNKKFPNRAKLAQDILKNPMKYGLDNSIMLGNFGEKTTNTVSKPKSKTQDDSSKIDRLNRRIKSYQKSIDKFSKIDKRIANDYQKRLDKAKKELSKLQG